MRIAFKWRLYSCLPKFADKFIWKRIEVVITALTRNQVYGNVSWVRIPPLPPSEKPLFSTRTKEVSLLWLED